MIVFVDCEVTKKELLVDIGGIKDNNSKIHTSSLKEFKSFIKDSDYLVGHNIIEYDSKYLELDNYKLIDTLYLSALLFPKKPYHKLVKDDKILTDAVNNPLNDSILCMNLFYDEIRTFNDLSNELKSIYYTILHDNKYFKNFFEYLNYKGNIIDNDFIKRYFCDYLCINKDIANYMEKYPLELSFVIALINTKDKYSLVPPWILKNYSNVYSILINLKSENCHNCKYCNQQLDLKKNLKKYFDYDNFRTYNGENLQEDCIKTALNHESLICIFPTGGGKSLTFQLPALIEGETIKGLTVVISPLQSLMKDQVDNLAKKGIVDAVYLNGLLNPIERGEYIKRVENGLANILYISPEQLRSRTIFNLLMKRHISRFVIDEAHCFSVWGQDFRVDYLYIGNFIKNLILKKNISSIPVSCFTATAKQKVITDIKDYFQKTLQLDLKLFATSTKRDNLRYQVIYCEEINKYNELRNLIETKNTPTIVYVSRIMRTEELALRLSKDGIPSLPYSGQMEPKIKILNQNKFINNEIKVMVATSAFGMGVDKSDVGLVVHYDISDSLENYIQESGRAGRDLSKLAECYVLYNEKDLDKHFQLLNQSKLSLSEIQQVWQAIKRQTKNRPILYKTPLELARDAGFDDNNLNTTTRVKGAILALENSGYIKRNMNMPRVFATSITVKNMEEAAKKIDTSEIFTIEEKVNAKRIMSYLISRKNDQEFARYTDVMADSLSLDKKVVINLIRKLKECYVLADDRDITISKDNQSYKKVDEKITKYLKIEYFLLQKNLTEFTTSLKSLNTEISIDIPNVKIIDLKRIFTFWVITGYIHKINFSNDRKFDIKLLNTSSNLLEKLTIRADICKFIINTIYNNPDDLVKISLLEITEEYKKRLIRYDIKVEDVENALLYLCKMEIINIYGGFFVLYNQMEIERLILDNKVLYKKSDYENLNEFYKNRIQQIHIVGEYANLMVKNYQKALDYVLDYFNLDYKVFIDKYFSLSKQKELTRNITSNKYKELFGTLSDVQREIIDDNKSKYIVVPSGPGSGKTRVLVHKLASLLLMEDVKPEQLLMLTFSRSAQIIFKKRLKELIKGLANYVDIKTFHSYAFDILGKIADNLEFDKIIKDACEMIENGEVSSDKIAKAVLVVDEAQDMNEEEYQLIELLIEFNPNMRVILVGDDDQNIFAFRGASSKYLQDFIIKYNAKVYEMTENYRSSIEIVEFASDFAKTISNRLKKRDLVCKGDKKGLVKLYKYQSSNFYDSLINNLIRNDNSESTCILTTTNEEALKLLGLLTRRGLECEVIQSNDGFNLYNLQEIRYFINIISKDNSVMIDNKVFEKVIFSLKNRFAKSVNLPNVLNLINDFDNVYPVKYQTDFIEFIKEAKYEDFYSLNKKIIISTIHKAKGREFSNVYLYLDNISNTDDDKKMLFVGITRAKNNLYVHYRGNLFNFYNLPIKYDGNIYKEPDILKIDLSFKDVFLDYFLNRNLNNLYAGMPLYYNDGYLDILNGDLKEHVAKLSKYGEIRLNDLIEKGYVPTSAAIRFIVYWSRGETEYLIILPSIYMVKNIYNKDKEFI